MVFHLVTSNRFGNRDHNITEESVHHFTDNIKNSRPLALVYIKKHFQSKKTEFNNIHSRNQSHIVVYLEDQDFKGTAF